MRFHCLGVGSIGSLVAFHLRRENPSPDHSVCLVVRRVAFRRDLLSTKDTSILIERDGLRRKISGFDVELHDDTADRLRALSAIRSMHRTNFKIPIADGETHLLPRKTTDYKAQRMPLHKDTIQSLIVTSKTSSTLRSISLLKPRLNASSTIFLLQNGMGVYDHLVSSIFRNPDTRPNFIIGSTTHGAWTKGVHDVVHSGLGRIHFGIVPDPFGRRDFELSNKSSQTPGQNPSLSLDDICPTDVPDRDQKFWTLRETTQALQRCNDLDVHWIPMAQMEVYLLRKLVVNACIGPLTALIGCRNGALYGDNSAHRAIRWVCSEAAAVFAAQAREEADLRRESAGGRPVPRPPDAKSLEAEVLRVIRATSTNLSSMLVDIRRGNRTEVEYINGHLSRLGRKYGVQTPRNDFLWETVRMKNRIPATPEKEDYL
ncbi:hypothetical protein BS47DRAFT_1332482 [Hydnum rufescens UP504]|uniref:2-dehydropantoate 2-reductase n=1 Tax=Hydnum rufescens UP504 TaxID=1448309 RepID=A0A9P6AN48_9AGAM|nr:hypothetical protein BS47DRAFT_1332482 [Hydnum rufescens UP504]